MTGIELLQKWRSDAEPDTAGGGLPNLALRECANQMELFLKALQDKESNWRKWGQKAQHIAENKGAVAAQGWGWEQCADELHVLIGENE